MSELRAECARRWPRRDPKWLATLGFVPVGRTTQLAPPAYLHRFYPSLPLALKRYRSSSEVLVGKRITQTIPPWFLGDSDYDIWRDRLRKNRSCQHGTGKASFFFGRLDRQMAHAAILAQDRQSHKFLCRPQARNWLFPVRLPHHWFLVDICR